VIDTRVGQRVIEGGVAADMVTGSHILRRDFLGDAVGRRRIAVVAIAAGIIHGDRVIEITVLHVQLGDRFQARTGIGVVVIPGACNVLVIRVQRLAVALVFPDVGAVEFQAEVRAHELEAARCVEVETGHAGAAAVDVGVVHQAQFADAAVVDGVARRILLHQGQELVVVGGVVDTNQLAGRQVGFAFQDVDDRTGTDFVTALDEVVVEAGAPVLDRLPHGAQGQRTRGFRFQVRVRRHEARQAARAVRVAEAVRLGLVGGGRAGGTLHQGIQLVGDRAAARVGQRVGDRAAAQAVTGFDDVRRAEAAGGGGTQHQAVGDGVAQAQLWRQVGIETGALVGAQRGVQLEVLQQRDVGFGEQRVLGPGIVHLQAEHADQLATQHVVRALHHVRVLADVGAERNVQRTGRQLGDGARHGRVEELDLGFAFGSTDREHRAQQGRIVLLAELVGAVDDRVGIALGADGAGCLGRARMRVAERRFPVPVTDGAVQGQHHALLVGIGAVEVEAVAGIHHARAVLDRRAVRVHRVTDRQFRIRERTDHLAGEHVVPDALRAGGRAVADAERGHDIVAGFAGGRDLEVGVDVLADAEMGAAGDRMALVVRPETGVRRGVPLAQLVARIDVGGRAARCGDDVGAAQEVVAGRRERALRIVGRAARGQAVPGRVMRAQVGLAVAVRLVGFGGQVGVEAILVDVAVTPDRRHVAVARVLEVRRFTVLALDLEALVVAAQDDVNHAGDGVRTVDCRGAVFQHLDALDGVGGDGIQVGEVLLGAVGQAVGRNAAAVDQDQGSNLAQAAHADARSAGCEAAGAGAGRADVGADRRHGGQDAQRRGLAGFLDVIAGQDLDRVRRLGLRTLDAGAGDLDALDLRIRRACFLRCSQSGNGQGDGQSDGTLLQNVFMLHNNSWDENYLSN